MSNIDKNNVKIRNLYENVLKKLFISLKEEFKNENIPEEYLENFINVRLYSYNNIFRELIKKWLINIFFLIQKM